MKKMVLMCIAGGLVLITMIGGTFAAFQANSSQGSSHITTKDLDIYLSEKGSGIQGLKEYRSGAVKAVPGNRIDENLVISSSASPHYDSYVRAIVYKAWGKTDQNGVFQKSFDDTLDTKMIKIVPENENDWIIFEEDSETITMYYKQPLSEAGVTETTKLIDEIILSMELGNEYADKSFVIEASADAVQAIGGTEAIKSAWGVDAHLDQEGNITDIVIK